MRTAICWFAAVTLAAICIAPSPIGGQVAPVNDLDDKEETSVNLEEITEGRIDIVFRIYRAFTREDVRRWQRWLNTSPEQDAFIWSVYEQYRKVYENAIEVRSPDLIASSRELIAISPKIFEFPSEYLDAQNRSLQLIGEMNVAADVAFDLFIERVKDILADVQKEKLWRVEMDRDRRKRHETYWEFDPSRVDLCVIIEDLHLPAEAQDAVDAVAVEYEKRVAPWVLRLEQEITKREPRMAKLDAYLLHDASGKLWPLGSEERLNAYLQNKQLQAELLKEGARLQESIHRVNKEFVPKFAETLPEEYAQQFVNSYRERAYWRVYPDRSVPIKLWESVRRSEVIDERTRVENESLWTHYQRDHQKISDLMERETDLYLGERAATHADVNGDPFRERMGQWQIDRIILSEAFVDRFEKLLLPEVQASLKNEFDQARRSIERAKANSGPHRFR